MKIIVRDEIEMGSGHWTSVYEYNESLSAKHQLEALLKNDMNWLGRIDDFGINDKDAYICSGDYSIDYCICEVEKNCEYEINIDESYANNDCVDEWGAGFYWLDDDRGVEYNFCIDGKYNCCAIYKMEMVYDGKGDKYMETDTSTFTHYEIDFSDADWRWELICAMRKAANKFFEGGK